MKKIILALVLIVSFNILNAQTTENKNFTKINLNSEKLKEGNEKLNIFLYKTLGEMKSSLKKQKDKLKDVNENNRYYSKVEKEKETLKILNEIKKIEGVIDVIRKKIASDRYTKAYNFQKTPQNVINHFFNAFKNNDFSKFDYLIDPFGEYSENMNFLNLMSVFTTYLKSDNPFEKFGKELNVEIVNTRIEKNKAYVLVTIKKEPTKNLYGDIRNNDIEKLFTLVNRQGYWYLIDISK